MVSNGWVHNRLMILAPADADALLHREADDDASGRCGSSFCSILILAVTVIQNVSLPFDAARMDSISRYSR